MTALTAFSALAFDSNSPWIMSTSSALFIVTSPLLRALSCAARRALRMARVRENFAIYTGPVRGGQGKKLETARRFGPVVSDPPAIIARAMGRAARWERACAVGEQGLAIFASRG